MTPAVIRKAYHQGLYRFDEALNSVMASKGWKREEAAKYLDNFTPDSEPMNITSLGAGKSNILVLR